MSKMHIGIGVFNMGMKSMRQATPIKIGEYFFAGLPVIIGYEDPRLPNKSDIPMWLQIDVFSANDLHHRVNMFIKDVRHNGLARESVHEYAKAHMLVKNYIDKILQ